MRFFSISGVACAASFLFGSAVLALPLAPGSSLDTGDYVDFGEVADGDPNWFGPSLGMFARSATEMRDGFDGFEIIEDLYVVSGVIESEVWRADAGEALTFGYGFSSIDAVGFGSGNGVAVFMVNGFMGYDVDIGWNYDSMPFAPLISRSVDGDKITVDYGFPDDTLQAFGAPYETILVRVNARDFRLGGTGVVDINIDTFGVTPRELHRLPAPSEVPLPLPAVLLAGALGLLGAMRSGVTRQS